MRPLLALAVGLAVGLAAVLVSGAAFAQAPGALNKAAISGGT